MMYTYIIIFAAVLFIVFLILLLSSSQALQRFAVIEVIGLAFVAFTVWFAYGEVKETIITNDFNSMMSYCERFAYDADFAEFAMVKEGITEEIGERILNDIEKSADFVIGVDKESYEEYGVINLTNNMVVVCEGNASGTDLSALAAEAKNSDESVVYTDLEGGKRAIIATSDKYISKDYGVYLIVNPEKENAQLQSILQRYVILAILVMVVFTAGLGVILFLQSRELKGLIRRIQRAASGIEDWNILQTRVPGLFNESDDIRTLRMSLNRLVEDDERVSHNIKERMYAYQRFAPHFVEKIFEGKNIKSLKPGERVELNTVAALVSLSLPTAKDKTSSEKIQSRFKQICEVKDNYNGLLTSTDHSMRELICMFTGEGSEAISFGMDVTKETDSSVLLHKTNFECGVVGTNEEYGVYTTSKETEILEKFVNNLRVMGLKLVVTDRVHELISKNIQARYIGFVEENNVKFKLYEVVDVYPADIRMLRMANMKKFAEAINLFYQDDFYLARNAFSDVLKEDPTDPVAMHYLFICEKNLNGEKVSVSYAMFSGE